MTSRLRNIHDGPPHNDDTMIQLEVVVVFYPTTVEHVIRVIQLGLLRWERDDWGNIFVRGGDLIALWGQPCYIVRN